MSYEDGWAALNLEMPPRVPRTEYSADRHWELISRATGTEVSKEDSPEEQDRASRLFRSPKGWNYDLVWNILIHSRHLGDFRTDMGHAEYDDGGSDFRVNRESWCKNPEDVLAFNPEESLPSYGHSELIRMFEEDYRRSVSENPDGVNMTGIYITLISGLLEMFGWDNLLMACGLDAPRFGEITDSYARWCQKFFDAMADSDVPVLMIHDDIVWTSGPFISPEWYRQHVFPNYRNYLRPLLDSGKKVLYTCDGDYSVFIDDVADSGFHGFVMEPDTDMAYIGEKYGKTHVFIGNADTRILLSGTREDIRKEVERCMNIGRQCPGYFMAVGNHIPANTPVENAMYYDEIYRELSRR